MDYDVITSLTSAIRRAKAFTMFQNSQLLSYILNGSNDSGVFWPDKRYIKKCGTYNGKEIDFKFEAVQFYNKSQLDVIMETSSCLIPKEPKLLFIQGPPGTGKSHTIGKFFL